MSLLDITIEGLRRGTLTIEEIKREVPYRGRKPVVRNFHYLVDHENGDRQTISLKVYNKCLEVINNFVEDKRKMIEDYIEEDENGGGLIEEDDDEVVLPEDE